MCTLKPDYGKHNLTSDQLVCGKYGLNCEQPSSTVERETQLAAID
jgi:hypothetical protein